MSKSLLVSDFVRQLVLEAVDMPPPTPNQVQPPAQIQQASTQAPTWINNPDTDKEIGAVGSEEVNAMGDIAQQRNTAISNAKLTLLQRAYKDAGVSKAITNTNIANTVNANFYTDPETKTVYCRILMPTIHYQSLVNYLKRLR